jgi:hypothetical protein
LHPAGAEAVCADATAAALDLLAQLGCDIGGSGGGCSSGIDGIDGLSLGLAQPHHHYHQPHLQQQQHHTGSYTQHANPYNHTGYGSAPAALNSSQPLLGRPIANGPQAYAACVRNGHHGGGGSGSFFVPTAEGYEFGAGWSGGNVPVAYPVSEPEPESAAVVNLLGSAGANALGHTRTHAHKHTRTRVHAQVPSHSAPPGSNGGASVGGMWSPTLLRHGSHPDVVLGGGGAGGAGGQLPIRRSHRASRENLPRPVVAVLKRWMFSHVAHPYPTEPEKSTICQAGAVACFLLVLVVLAALGVCGLGAAAVCQGGFGVLHAVPYIACILGEAAAARVGEVCVRACRAVLCSLGRMGAQGVHWHTHTYACA